MMLYASWNKSPALDFLLSRPGNYISYDKFARLDWWHEPSNLDELISLANRLLTMGLTVLWRDITATEAISLGKVVRVVVPEMLPLSQDHNARWLGTPRLARRWSAEQSGEMNINPFPHPFA
jgi:ribosomal protein S12 methylthiotransferase accessory factor